MPYDAPMWNLGLGEEELLPLAKKYLGVPEEPFPQAAPELQAPLPAPEAPAQQGTPAGPSLAERFLAAQQRGSRDALLNRTGAGFDSAARAILSSAGVNVGPTVTERPELRGQPVDDLEAQVRLEQAGQKTAQAKPGRPTKSTDPNSPESKALQQAMKGLYPDIPEAVVNAITEDNYENFRKSFVAREGVTERDRLANERAARDAEQFAETMGFRWSQLDANQRLGFARIAAAERARADAADREAKKTDRSLAERNVGGFEFDPTNPPSTEAAKKMADAAIARDEIIASLGNLEKMYGAGGSALVGERAGEMEAEWINITNRLRTLNDMGVPNGADYLMLAKQIEDPTTFRSLSTSKQRGLAKMRTLREQVTRKVEATANALKYRPVGSKASPLPSRAPAADVLPKGADGQPTLDPGSTPPAPASGGDTVRVIINGKPKRVPRKSLDAVKKLVRERGDALEVSDG